MVIDAVAKQPAGGGRILGDLLSGVACLTSAELKHHYGLAIS
jgi:hypothetical protein